MGQSSRQIFYSHNRAQTSIICRGHDEIIYSLFNFIKNMSIFDKNESRATFDMYMYMVPQSQSS